MLLSLLKLDHRALKGRCLRLLLMILAAELVVLLCLRGIFAAEGQEMSGYLAMVVMLAIYGFLPLALTAAAGVSRRSEEVLCTERSQFYLSIPTSPALHIVSKAVYLVVLLMGCGFIWQLVVLTAGHTARLAGSSIDGKIVVANSNFFLMQFSALALFISALSVLFSLLRKSPKTRGVIIAAAAAVEVVVVAMPLSEMASFLLSPMLLLTYRAQEVMRRYIFIGAAHLAAAAAIYAIAAVLLCKKYDFYKQ